MKIIKKSLIKPLTNVLTGVILAMLRMKRGMKL